MMYLDIDIFTRSWLGFKLVSFPLNNDILYQSLCFIALHCEDKIVDIGKKKVVDISLWQMKDTIKGDFKITIWHF